MTAKTAKARTSPPTRPPSGDARPASPGRGRAKPAVRWSPTPSPCSTAGHAPAYGPAAPPGTGQGATGAVAGVDAGMDRRYRCGPLRRCPGLAPRQGSPWPRWTPSWTASASSSACAAASPPSQCWPAPRPASAACLRNSRPGTPAPRLKAGHAGRQHGLPSLGTTGSRVPATSSRRCGTRHGQTADQTPLRHGGAHAFHSRGRGNQTFHPHQHGHHRDRTNATQAAHPNRLPTEDGASVNGRHP